MFESNTILLDKNAIKKWHSETKMEIESLESKMFESYESQLLSVDTAFQKVSKFQQIELGRLRTLEKYLRNQYDLVSKHKMIENENEKARQRCIERDEKICPNVEDLRRFEKRIYSHTPVKSIKREDLQHLQTKKWSHLLSSEEREELAKKMESFVLIKSW